MISVIIPHKNSLSLLQRCVDSIPVTTDIEVLVIDDNSDILQEDWKLFSERYNNVRLFLTKEGRGAGYARNVGLNKAMGDWIVFADADDYFYPHAFDTIAQFITGNHYDMVFFDTNSRDGETNEIVKSRQVNINKGIATRNIDLLRYRTYVPWGKVFNRELIINHGIMFEEIEVSNDVMFVTKASYYAKDFGIISDCLYCSTINKNSLFYQSSIQRIESRIETANRVNAFLYENGVKKYRVYCMNYIFYFFPKHPMLFLKYLIRCRYKGETFSYIVEILKKLMISLISAKTKNC